jgi:hypothetical protein
MGFAVEKVALGQFSPSTSVSPANSHSTSCSILIIYMGCSIGQLVANVPCGLSFTTPQEKRGGKKRLTPNQMQNQLPRNKDRDNVLRRVTV